MSELTLLDAKTVAKRLAAGEITLVDIREPDEHAREHIKGAVSLPLSRLTDSHLDVAAHGDVVFHCRSGMRTNSNCDRLSSHVSGNAFALEGGLEAWKSAGLAVSKQADAPIELNRQVQIAIGVSILTGVVLALMVHPAFIALPAFFGGGLLFAGISGWCGMAHLLALAPWNRRPAS